MDQQTSQERKDAVRKANFIERNAYLYRTDGVFHMLVDSTQYFSQAEQQESMAKIGGQYRANGSFLNL
jgi:hypothetical protein